MIVPQTRLLFWFALVALPFSTLGVTAPGAAIYAVTFIAGFLALVLADAILSLRTLDGISVTLPAVLRTSKDRPTSIPVDIENRHRRPLTLRVGLALPRELRSEQDDRRVLLAVDTELSRVDWPCHPLKRGNYRLNKVCLEAASRLGFWGIRHSAVVASEVRVYPNPAADRKKLGALFLNRGALGVHAQRQVGQGRDFEKLREYIPGDGYDEIHWKATAKRGHPVTKVFQVERTQEVYLVIDASRLSARRFPRQPELAGAGATPSHDQHRTASVAPDSLPGLPPAETETVLERFLTSALVLGQAAEHQGDLFGLITFTNQIQTFLRARNGKAHYSTCRDAIYTLEPQGVTPDFDEICSSLRTRLRRRALLIFLTSLEDPVSTEHFVRNLTLLARQHLVLVNMIQPPGMHPLFTRPDVETTDDIYRHLGGHIHRHQLRELEKILQRRGVRFSMVENAELATQLVSQYLEVKQRQLL